MTAQPAEVVPGRACGQCTLCCKLMQVDDLGKAAGRWCAHVRQGLGCGIYNARPSACRTFLCGYLTTAGLDDAWYPARAKIILVSKETGITALVDPSRPHAWREQRYYEQLKTWAKQMSPKGMVMLVKVGARAVVVLPDEDVDLGVVHRDDDVFLEIGNGPTGPIYRVSHERKGAA